MQCEARYATRVLGGSGWLGDAADGVSEVPAADVSWLA